MSNAQALIFIAAVAIAARCPLDGAQDASIRFVGGQSQQSSVLDVRLGEGQSAISDGARAAHVLASRKASCRSGPA
jgi:hypothetical protein